MTADAQHARIWLALDTIAARHGLSASGLAVKAGLDATTFNKSKRVTPAGKARWPSSESIARALDAVGADYLDFAEIVCERPINAGRTIPVVRLAAKETLRFDSDGLPLAGAETLRFPDLGDAPLFAVAISGAAMEPVYRDGAVVIVQPGAPVRPGDRVVVRTRDGAVLVCLAGARGMQTFGAVAAVQPSLIAKSDIDWMARILWASQ